MKMAMRGLPAQSDDNPIFQHLTHFDTFPSDQQIEFMTPNGTFAWKLGTITYRR